MSIQKIDDERLLAANRFHITQPDLPEMSAEEKRAVLAGVCAVIAEELGTDVSNIRVRSFRRIQNFEIKGESRGKFKIKIGGK